MQEKKLSLDVGREKERPAYAYSEFLEIAAVPSL